MVSIDNLPKCKLYNFNPNDSSFGMILKNANEYISDKYCVKIEHLCSYLYKISSEKSVPCNKQIIKSVLFPCIDSTNEFIQDKYVSDIQMIYPIQGKHKFDSQHIFLVYYFNER